MRNLLAFVGAAVVTFAVVGWYLDWYKVKSEPVSAGHQSVNIDLNRVKIADDVHNGIQKGEETLHGVLEKEGQDKQAATGPTGTGKTLPNE